MNEVKEKILFALNAYMLHVEDDDIYEAWGNAYPDDMSLEEIVENDKIWLKIIDHFVTLISDYTERD